MADGGWTRAAASLHALRSTFSVAAIDVSMTDMVVGRMEEAAGHAYTHHELALPEVWDALFPLNHYLDVYEMDAPYPTYSLQELAQAGNVPLAAPTLTLDRVRTPPHPRATRATGGVHAKQAGGRAAGPRRPAGGCVCGNKTTAHRTSTSRTTTRAASRYSATTEACSGPSCASRAM